MSKPSQLRCAALLGLASACASAPPKPAARMTALAPVELQASRDVGQAAPSTPSASALTATTTTRTVIAPAPRTAAAAVRPAVLLVLSAPADPSGALDDAARTRIAVQLGRAVERRGFATVAPDALPTQHELAARGQTAFAVAPAIERVTRAGSVECRVAIRVAPWHGRDGGERWDTGRTALIHATARVDGGRARTAVSDCVEAAVEDATARHVVGFLDRVATAP